MAPIFRPNSSRILPLFLAVFFFFLCLPIAINSVPEQELDSMIEVLRATGYNLFCNAISTTDLGLNLLSGTSFTLFAPSDSSLFALDMTNSASDYITHLNYHVVPRRFSFGYLRRLPFGSTVPTLLPNLRIHIGLRRSLLSEIVTADGVDIVLPGFFLGRHICVHGLGGILSFKSQITSNGEPPPPLFPPPSPAVNNHRQAKTPSDHLFGERSSGKGADRSHNSSAPHKANRAGDSLFMPPAPETASIDGISPSYSPATGGFPPNMSPSYGFWLAPRPFAPGSEPTAPPDENLDLEVRSLSTGGRRGSYGGDAKANDTERNYSNSNERSVIGMGEKDDSKGKNRILNGTPAMLEQEEEVSGGIRSTAPEACEPLDANTINCRVIDEALRFEHVTAH